jgi:hypothetical protein
VQYAQLLKTAQRLGVGKQKPATVAEHVTLRVPNSHCDTVAEAEQRLRENPGQPHGWNDRNLVTYKTTFKLNSVLG